MNGAGGGSCDTCMRVWPNSIYDFPIVLIWKNEVGGFVVD